MALTRGPLPSSVYWRRRLMILTFALLLVVVIAKVLGGGSDGRSEGAAEQVAAGSSPTVTVTITPSGSAATTSPRGGAGGKHGAVPPAAPSTTALPTPTGDCDPAEIAVTPVVKDAYVGSPVTVTLQLRTTTTPACTWDVSSDAVQVRISKGGTTVWSTLDCPKAVPSSAVTVYRDAVSNLALTWLGHSSDQTCSVHTPWATRGTYQISASALGGEPADSTFQLGVAGETPSDTPSGADGSIPSGTPSQSVTPTLTPYGAPTGTTAGSTGSTGSAAGSPSGSPLKR